jgi:uncharacterized membrane protein
MQLSLIHKLRGKTRRKSKRSKRKKYKKSFLCLTFLIIFFLNSNHMYIWIIFILIWFLKFQLDKIKSPLKPSGHKNWTEKLLKLKES